MVPSRGLTILSGLIPLPFCWPSTSSTLLLGLAVTLRSFRIRTLSSAIGTQIRKLGKYTHSSSLQLAQRLTMLPISSSTYYVLWPRMHWISPAVWEVARHPRPRVMHWSQVLTVGRSFLCEDSLLGADWPSLEERFRWHSSPWAECSQALRQWTSHEAQ